MGFKNLKQLILKLTPQKIINLYQSPLKSPQEDLYSTLSYSQEGEDLILKRLFDGQQKGLYVDVGAHHPKRFSNTYLFYKMGWRGINIDAMPGSMEKFKEVRPEDINIEAAISDKDELLTYYIFNETALNTFSKNEAEQKAGKGNYIVIDEIKINTIPLSQVLNKHLDSNKQIDFLNIDVEGYDFKVLDSIDWTVYKPSVVLIEVLNIDLENLIDSKVYKFLRERAYKMIAKTFNTLIFIKEK
ncbi:FkbM family methyltransferase [Salegentibacter sp. BLCTC]|uniref:FkbM family methyltransferase n=1 Tax=Salegentibacter sp. BLCTC TaxID=2697368 RepID=UPI00187B5259|nr:FkbM family methyltransferase [Salegentibacter sp. BLCTC]MBE7639816.1 FkbM family methyltransferase [Salegentibacter sp. BLCTC]